VCECVEEHKYGVLPKIRQHIQGKGSGVDLTSNFPVNLPPVQLRLSLSFNQTSSSENICLFVQEGRFFSKQFTIVALSVILLSYIKKKIKEKNKKVNNNTNSRPTPPPSSRTIFVCPQFVQNSSIECLLLPSSSLSLSLYRVYTLKLVDLELN